MRLLAPALMALALALTGTMARSAPTPGAEAAFDWFAYEGHDPVYQDFKAGPDDYLNPILAGFYPDPSITRVGDDYYLVNSTFCYFPGIPVFHSRDLVHWTQIGNAIDRPTQLNFAGLGLSRGVFAPAISHHDGLFYILNTCVDCGGNFVITAKDPAGPWSDPVWLPIDGIDTDLFFDDDGRTWVLNNGPPEGTPQYEGHRAIWIQQFDPKALKPIGPRTVLVNGGVDFSKKPIWAEGPHIFRAQGRYYLITAEGGTGAGHSEVVYRSDKVLGPYVPWSGNPILTQRQLDPSRPHPVTSAGHAQFVQTPEGEWWSIFLATRPHAGDAYNTGRETFLLPVHWQDGWPVILSGDETVPYVHHRPDLPPAPKPAIPTHGDFTVRDDFNGPLKPDWLTIRNPLERWWRFESGHLILVARPQPIGRLTSQPSFLGRRQQHGWATASTAMRYIPQRPGDKAGLLALQSDDYFYFLGVTLQDGKTVVRLERRAGPKDDPEGAVVASAPIDLKPGAPIYLRIQVRGGLYDFSYGLHDGQWIPLKRDADGEILSTKVAGGFVGAVIGVYAVRAD